ncbi:hypothetical protein D6777_04155 [Candidatus Woesearchaeota archaeon]|nr:MAG: hypothetical protein D6777_04155 [Candidatus Woesearchaeota archaeon]
MLLVLSASVSATGALFSIGTTDVRVDVLRYDPAPLEPGNVADMWVKVTTQGNTLSEIRTLNNVKLEFVNDFPFTAVSDEEKVKSFGTMQPGEVRVVKFKIKVDNDANPGTNEVRFKFHYNNDEVTTAPIEVEVQSTSATIAVEKVNLEPKQVLPGQTAKLTISLRNDDLGLLKDITAKLDLSSSSLPFAPLKSTTEQKVRSIKPGDMKEIEYDLIALPDADANVYKVPFELTYYDEAGNQFTKSDTIGIIVGADPKLNVALEESDAFSEGMNGKVVVSVSNVGASDVKYVTVRLKQGQGYLILGKKQEYLGNLESDDFETSEFKLYVKDDVKEKVMLNLEIEYRDAYNNLMKEERSLELPVYTRKELRAYNLDGSLKSVYTPIIYILAIFFLYFAVKDWRKHKALDSAMKAGVEGIFLTLFRILFFFRWRNVKRLPMKVKMFFQKI